MNSKLEIYLDSNKKGKYRWRITAHNGRIIGASSQGYTRRIVCARNAESVANEICLAIADGILL